MCNLAKGKFVEVEIEDFAVIVIVEAVDEVVELLVAVVGGFVGNVFQSDSFA